MFVIFYNEVTSIYGVCCALKFAKVVPDFLISPDSE